MVILIIAIVLGVAVRTHADNQPTKACYSTMQHKATGATASLTDGTKWLHTGQCPTPGTLSCPKGYEQAPLLVISLDGFRADYLQRNVTPVLSKLAGCGVRAEFTRGIYPTKTFPNHYTIATVMHLCANVSSNVQVFFWLIELTIILFPALVVDLLDILYYFVRLCLVYWTLEYNMFEPDFKFSSYRLL